MSLSTMIESHPYDLPIKEHAAALEALVQCAAHCRLCADACLAGDDVASKSRCIRSDLDCAAICEATAEVIAQPGDSGAPWREQLRICIEMVQACADECGSHEEAHCRECASSCRDTVAALQTLLDAVT